MKLTGRISDRIRAGIPGVDPLAPRFETDDRPRPSSIRTGSGYGLGRGSARSGEGAS